MVRRVDFSSYIHVRQDVNGPSVHVRRLRIMYIHFPNLDFSGFVTNQDLDLSQIHDKSRHLDLNQDCRDLNQDTNQDFKISGLSKDSRCHPLNLKG